MKSEKFTKFMLTIICFIVYMCIFAAVMANAFNTNLHHFLLGQKDNSYLSEPRA